MNKQTKSFKYIIQDVEKHIQVKKDIIANAKNHNMETYGFSSDYHLPLWHNLENTIKKMTKLEYLHRPSQMSYHNLCKNIHPPNGIGITLGLGLKFCIQSNTPPPNLNKSYIRFVQDVRKRYIFAGIKQPETPKKIYTKSEWTPDKTEDHIEQRLMKFIS